MKLLATTEMPQIDRGPVLEGRSWEVPGSNHRSLVGSKSWFALVSPMVVLDMGAVLVQAFSGHGVGAAVVSEWMSQPRCFCCLMWGSI